MSSHIQGTHYICDTYRAHNTYVSHLQCIQQICHADIQGIHDVGRPQGPHMAMSQIALYVTYTQTCRSCRAYSTCVAYKAVSRILVHICRYVAYIGLICDTHDPDICTMGWLRLVASIKLQVSFAKEPYTRDDILQKRPIILSILLTVATRYMDYQPNIYRIFFV